MSVSKCPNCEARFAGRNDHDTGQPTPNRWLCDTHTVVYEQPVFKFTFATAQLIWAFLLTHPDSNANKLANVFDGE